jgi:hypothetical protein
MNFQRSQADPCLYYKWNEHHGYTIWLSWCDDLACFGDKTAVDSAVQDVSTHFDVDDVGDMKDYLGCALDIDRTKRTCKISQPTLIQSLHDEYEPGPDPIPLPATPGVVLKRAAEGEEVGAAQHKQYRNKVGRVSHIARWSRSDILNAIREASRHCQKSNPSHNTYMDKIITYLAHTPNRGWFLHPTRVWDGISKTFKFRILGKSDSNYATCTDTRKSVTGYVVYLEEAPVAVRSTMQKIIALSSTEAELIALVQCVQEMFFVKKIIESMELKVELPMIIQCDNKGAVDLVNGHSIGGNSKHIDVRILHVRDYKDKGVIKVEWISTKDNEADMQTKNTNPPTFIRHAPKYVGKDEYK